MHAGKCRNRIGRRLHATFKATLRVQEVSGSLEYISTQFNSIQKYGVRRTPYGK